MKGFGAEWTNYQTFVLGPGTHRIQVEETRRAFYSGAFALLTLLMEQLSAGGEVNDGDLDYITSLRRELLDFFSSEIESMKEKPDASTSA